MKSRRNLISLALSAVLCCFSHAQVATTQPAVPRLVNFSGKAMDSQRRLIAGTAGVTFAIYKDQYEGAPLWMETQTVQPDKSGNYTVQLGATRFAGLPLELFSSGEARWLGVRMNGGEEQPRVLLLSVPYALKAADAQTLGGLPPSAFVLASPVVGAANPQASEGSGAAGSASIPPPATITGSGTPNFIPLFTGAAAIGSSALFQTGSSPTAKIGVNLSSPTAALEVQGTGVVHGQFTMPSAGVATASAGKESYPLDLRAAAYNSSTKASVFQNFLWEAEPVGNNTTNPGGTLNLLFAAGSASPAETGLKIASNGQITFAPGQTFPGGSGTVTSVALSAPSSDFTVSGSPVTGSGTLGLHWTVAPTAGDVANAIVKRDSSGSFSGGVITAVNVTATNSTGAAVWGQSGGTSGGSDGVHGVTSSASGSGVAGVNSSGASNGIGVYGVGGIGVYGTSSTGQAVWGESAGTGFSNGSGPDGVHGVTHSNAGSGVGGLNTADGGVGIWGEAPTGFGFYTPNNVQQARAAGGWVKAMVLGSGGNGNFPAGVIVSCFNSTLAGAAATTPPCGFTFDQTGIGDYIVNFGFQVSDRFFSVTTHTANPSPGVCTSFTGSCPHSLSVNEAEVTLWAPSVQLYTDSDFYLIVY